MSLSVGDRVKVLRNVSGRDVEGRYGIIVTELIGLDYGVEFEDWEGGHSCDGFGEEGKCLWVYPNDMVFAGKKKSGLTKFYERVA